MKLRSLGYAGQNVTLNLTTGRTLRLSNLNAERVRNIISANLDDLEAILQWNLRHGIRFFRMGSSIVPFASHPDFPIDWQTEFGSRLTAIRAFVRRHDLRLSMHPGQYTVLNSPDQGVAERAVQELEYHAQFLQAVAPANGTMTLHVGGAYGDKAAALERFAANAGQLSATARARLTLENDDRLFTIREVLELCEALECPAVFDFFHHKCNPVGGGWQEGLLRMLERVVSTWRNRVPKLHLSSPKEERKSAHADYVTEKDFGEVKAVMAGLNGDEVFDLMLEAKMKDKAVLRVLRFEDRGMA